MTIFYVSKKTSLSLKHVYVHGIEFRLNSSFVSDRFCYKAIVKSHAFNIAGLVYKRQIDLICKTTAEISSTIDSTLIKVTSCKKYLLSSLPPQIRTVGFQNNHKFDRKVQIYKTDMLFLLSH